jgi:hypothetical protein
MLNWDLIKNLANKSSYGAEKHGMEKDSKGHFIQQHKQQITIGALLMCKVFASHRPDNSKTPDCPFFLTVNHKRKVDSLFGIPKVHLGRTPLGCFL